MKKSTIWILTILMVLTFAGLLSMQIMYMTNMIKMRDDQFSEGVRRSLYAVTSLLEQDISLKKMLTASKQPLSAGHRRGLKE